MCTRTGRGAPRRTVPASCAVSSCTYAALYSATVTRLNGGTSRYRRFISYTPPPKGALSRAGARAMRQERLHTKAVRRPEGRGAQRRMKASACGVRPVTKVHAWGGWIRTHRLLPPHILCVSHLHPPRTGRPPPGKDRATSFRGDQGIRVLKSRRASCMMPSTMTFPADWPDCCPPTDASAAHGVVYRLVRSLPATSTDFKTQHELGKMPNADPCLRRGLSVLRSKRGCQPSTSTHAKDGWVHSLWHP